MALAPAELAAQIRQTAAFIAADPVTIAAERTPLARVPGGGRGPAAQPTAISWACRIIRGGIGEEARTDAGAVVRRTVTVMGLPGLNVAVRDEFDYDGFRFEVTAVQRDIAYEVKARAVSRG